MSDDPTDTRKWRPTAGTAPHRVSLRLSDTEHGYLAARAEAYGCDVPTALRLLISAYEPPISRLDRDAQRHIWRQVRGIGVNVNQLALAANLWHEPMREEIAGLRREVSRLVATIRELAGLEASS